MCGHRFRCDAITTKHGPTNHPLTAQNPISHAPSDRPPEAGHPSPKTTSRGTGPVTSAALNGFRGARGYLLAGARAVERRDGGVEQRHVDGPAQIPQLLRRHGARGGALGARRFWKRAGGGLVRPEKVGEGSEAGERRGEAAEEGIPGGGGRIRARDFELFRRSRGV